MQPCSLLLTDEKLQNVTSSNTDICAKHAVPVRDVTDRLPDKRRCWLLHVLDFQTSTLNELECKRSEKVLSVYFCSVALATTCAAVSLRTPSTEGSELSFTPPPPSPPGYSPTSFPSDPYLVLGWIVKDATIWDCLPHLAKTSVPCLIWLQPVLLIFSPPVSVLIPKFLLGINQFFHSVAVFWFNKKKKKSFCGNNCEVILLIRRSSKKAVLHIKLICCFMERSLSM